MTGISGPVRAELPPAKPVKFIVAVPAIGMTTAAAAIRDLFRVPNDSPGMIRTPCACRAGSGS